MRRVRQLSLRQGPGGAPPAHEPDRRGESSSRITACDFRARLLVLPPLSLFLAVSGSIHSQDRARVHARIPRRPMCPSNPNPRQQALGVCDVVASMQDLFGRAPSKNALHYALVGSVKGLTEAGYAPSRLAGGERSITGFGMGRHLDHGCLGKLVCELAIRGWLIAKASRCMFNSFFFLLSCS